MRPGFFVGGVYTRPRRPSAALRLCAIEAAMPRWRALSANIGNASCLPANLFSMGMHRGGNGFVMGMGSEKTV